MTNVIAESRARIPALSKPILILTGCTLSILAALIALMNGVPPKWSVLFVVAFPASVLLLRATPKAIERAEKVDLFSPVVAFPVVYLAWFAIGSIDFIDVPRSVSFGLFEPIPAYVLGYAALGLASYMAGCLVSSKKILPRERFSKIEFDWIEFDWIEDRFWLVVTALAALMLASFAYMVVGIGVVPALVADAGEVRLKISNYGPEQAVMFTAAWSLIPMLMMYVWLRRPKRSKRFLCYGIVALATGLLFSLGARTNLFVPLLTALVAQHYAKAKFRIGRLIVVGAAIFCALSLFGYVRDTSLTGSTSGADQLGISGPIIPFAYAYLYIRYPVATLRDITTIIPAKVPFQWGALTFGPLATILPGHHQLSDMFFKDILGNNFIGAGQPATLLGPLYGDAGLVGILLGVFLFAQLITRTYRWMHRRPSAFRILLYAWLVQTLLFSLFSNFFPFITTIWIPAFWGLVHLLLRPRPIPERASAQTIC